MNAKDFRNVLFYMWNKWSMEECNSIFNEGADMDEWMYSFGFHIWSKWMEFVNSCGSTNAIGSFFANIDNNCLQLIIDRSINYYGKA